MKNNLFSKLVALFLTGAMLTGVGCKDYDGDIDDINKKLDDLTGKVALKTDLTAMQSSITKLEAIDHGAFLKTSDFQTKFDAALTAAKVASKDDIKNFLTSDQIKALIAGYGYQNAQQVKDLISANTLKEADIKAIFNSMIATDDAYAKFQSKVLADIATKLGQWTLNSTQMDAIKASMATALADENGAFRASINTWLGKDFEKYMVEYMKGDAFKSASSSAAIAAINAQIGDAQKSLVENINKMIDDAVASNKESYLKIEDLNTKFGTYTETITKLAGQIAALEGRIQSLVWVPTSLGEVEYNAIVVKAADYFVNAAGDRIYATDKKPQVIEVTYRVSPAALATQMTTTNVQFVAEKLTRADANLLKITEVKNADATTGKFTVVAETNYRFIADHSIVNTLAFALNVKMDGAKDAQGIDFTSAFTGMEPGPGGNVASHIVVAVKNADNTYTELGDNNSFYETRLPYSDTKTVNFFDGFGVYYKEGTTYEAIADRWMGVTFQPTFNPGTSVSAHPANYTLTNTTAKIKTSDTDLIGDVITSGNLGVRVTVDGQDAMDKLYAKQRITVIGNDTPVAATTNATLAWKYAIAKSDATSRNVYTAAPVTLESGKISAAIFNALTSPVVTVAAPQGVTAPFSATLAKASTPSADSDVQKITATITGDLKVGGVYTIVAVYTLADNNTVTITIPVTVAGMPALPEVTIPAKEFAYAGVARIFELVSKYAESIWTDSYKPAFADKNEFVAAINGATAAITKNGKATLAINGVNLDVVFDADAVYGTAYKPSLVLTDAKLTGLTVTFKTAGVTLTDANAKLTKVTNFFDAADGKALAITKFPTASTFSVVDKLLDGAYSYTGTIANTKIVYSLDNTQFGTFAGTKPVITNNKLVWGTWNKLVVNVTVQLQAQDGTLLDEQKFDVKINDPVAASITLASTKASISLTSGTLTADVVASMTMKETVSGSANKNIFKSGEAQGLDADLKAALTGSATYEIVESSLGTLDKTKFSVNANGVLTTTLDPSLTLLNPQEVLVKVTYKYQFGDRSVNVPVIIKK